MTKIIKILSLCFLINPVFSANLNSIAHRGASAYAPENTLSSVRKALEFGVKFIEIDVHMTKDGDIVALHDSSIDRTSNGTGKVSNYNLADLKKLDFGSWFSTEFTGEKIPTLREVLKATGVNATLIIELKEGGFKYPNIEHKIVEIVKSMNLSSYVILKSFSYEILNKFELLAPDIKRLYCTIGGGSWFTIDNSLRFKSIFEGSSYQYLQVHKYFLTDWIIEQSLKRRIKLVVWDVHDKQTMSQVIKRGVDFIESDNPDYVLYQK